MIFKFSKPNILFFGQNFIHVTDNILSLYSKQILLNTSHNKLPKFNPSHELPACHIFTDIMARRESRYDLHLIVQTNNVHCLVYTVKCVGYPVLE
jgi:hypothetical protein